MTFSSNKLEHNYQLGDDVARIKANIEDLENMTKFLRGVHVYPPSLYEYHDTFNDIRFNLEKLILITISSLKEYIDRLSGHKSNLAPLFPTIDGTEGESTTTINRESSLYIAPIIFCKMENPTLTNPDQFDSTTKYYIDKAYKQLKDIKGWLAWSICSYHDIFDDESLIFEDFDHVLYLIDFVEKRFGKIQPDTTLSAFYKKRHDFILTYATLTLGEHNENTSTTKDDVIKVIEEKF